MMHYKKQLYAIVSIACVLVFGIAYVSWQNDQRYIEDKTAEFQRNQLRFAEQVSAKVQASFDKLYDALYILSQIPKIQFLAQNETVLHMIRTFKMNQHLIEGIGRIDTEGAVRYVYPKTLPQPTDEELESIFQHGRMTGESVFHIIRRHHDATDILIVARPVYTVQGEVHLNPSNKFTGLIYFVTTLKHLHTALFGVPVFGENGNLWMIDDQGWVSGASNAAQIGKPLETLLSSAPTTANEVSFSYLLSMMQMGVPNVEDYDEKNLLAFMPLSLPYQTWTIVVHHTSDEVRRSIQQVIAERWLLSLAMVGTVLTMTCFLIVMTRRNYQREMQAVHEAEGALRESEERYRRLVELSPDAIYVHNGDTFIYVNPAGAMLLGANEPGALLNCSILDVVCTDCIEGAEEQARWVYQGREESHLVEVQLMRLDGQPVDVEAVSVPVVYDKKPAVQVMVRDVTERKQAAAELARHAKELARSNTDLEQFAYVASHDLQEPLRKVVSFTDLLAKHFAGRLDAEAETFMSYIIDGALRMQGLIRDLLAYSRVGRGDGTFEPTDLNTVLKETLATLDLVIREQQADVTSTPLPHVLSQPSLMRQLFQNLIGNALKFRGTEPPCIHISAEQQGDAWHFAVRDNGIGIDPQYTERIFIIFQRLHSRAEYSGTGIGLAICQKIVDRHGGRIWVESELGQGTTFHFTLPVLD